MQLQKQLGVGGIQKYSLKISFCLSIKNGFNTTHSSMLYRHNIHNTASLFDVTESDTEYWST
jgi:hypothetical protein